MQKLTETDIERLHYWAQNGVDNRVIANRLGVHRNTVSLHLNGRVAYKPALVFRLRLKAPAQPKIDNPQLLTVYAAALILPDQPSHDRLWRLIKNGYLKTVKENGRTLTRMPWVRKCALAMLPKPGLYFRRDSLQLYATHGSDVDKLLATLAPKRVQSPLTPNLKRVSYYPAPAVNRVCELLEIPLRVPAYRISIAVTCLDQVGVHVI